MDSQRIANKPGVAGLAWAVERMLFDELMWVIFNGWANAPVAGPIIASGPTTRGSKEIFFAVA